VGKAAVLVTHDLAEAYQIADVVVMCEDGKTTAPWPRTTCSGILPQSAWRGSSRAHRPLRRHR
jgi:ABC-type nitrate/sulfonate/bicarbonate transport system ATPase subunit